MPEQLTLPVRGMHCAACVGKVESALAGVPGVETASVNLATERATVAFDPARADVGTLQAAVAAAGYELAEAPTPRGGEAEAREQAVRELEQRRLGRHIESCVTDALRSGSKSERQQKVDELLEVFARFGAR